MKMHTPSQAELMLCGRIIGARLGWFGFAGVLMIVLWGIAEFAWLPRMNEQIERSELESRSLRQQIVRINAEGVRNLDPQVRLEALLVEFPTRRQLPQELARLEKTLTEIGVRVDKTDFQPDTVNSFKGDFSATAVSMTLKLPYPKLRAALDAVREKMPTVAIEDVQVKRDAIGSTEAEVRLRFKLYMRQRA